MNDITQPNNHFARIKEALALAKKYKTCEACGRVLPRTDTYWYMANGYIRTNCKACTIKKNVAYRARVRAEELKRK